MPRRGFPDDHFFAVDQIDLNEFQRSIFNRSCGLLLVLRARFPYKSIVSPLKCPKKFRGFECTRFDDKFEQWLERSEVDFITNQNEFSKLLLRQNSGRYDVLERIQVRQNRATKQFRNCRIRPGGGAKKITPVSEKLPTFEFLFQKKSAISSVRQLLISTEI